MPPRSLLPLLFVVFVATACGGSGQDWVKDLDRSSDLESGSSLESSAAPPGRAGRASPPRTVVIGEARTPPPEGASGDSPAVGEVRAGAPAAGGGGPFRNTYYDFPSESAAGSGATLYDAACKPLANVDTAFHDAICVQGSGRLASGVTVSFAKRDCPCASVCPRTGQRICFEALDPARYPWGRGATGKPIAPLRTVAVDTSVIPLGARLFIPEAVGLPRPDGTAHDGCFVAEDRGKRVVGEHVDIFTGAPATTALWNARLPSNRGVHVVVGAPRCGK